MNKPRQEEAFEYIAEMFIKLVQRDKEIPHKKEVVAWWQDFFEHPGVRGNMIQAFSNFLWEIDEKMDAARKAGMMQIKEAFDQAFTVEKGTLSSGTGMQAMTESAVYYTLDMAMAEESSPEQKILTESDVEKMDLTEVGGGDEDNTPLM